MPIVVIAGYFFTIPQFPFNKRDARFKIYFSGRFFTENSFLPFLSYFYKYFCNTRILDETPKIDLNVKISMFLLVTIDLADPIYPEIIFCSFNLLNKDTSFVHAN
jgi:hypothetical protein